MEHYPQNAILMVKGTLSKIDAALLHHWINIAFFIKDQLNLKINVEVFENELNLAIRREQP